VLKWATAKRKERKEKDFEKKDSKKGEKRYFLYCLDQI